MRHCKAAELEPCNWPSCDCVEDLSALPDEAGEMVRKLHGLHEPQCRAVEPPYSDCNCVIGRTARKAVSLIERLAPRWISVEERLPEKGHDARCLCWIMQRHGTGDFGWIGLRAFHHERECWLNNTVENIEADGEHVLYWQPLPLPPQKGST